MGKQVSVSRHLIHLAEECAEVQKVVAKIARFGPEPRHLKALTEEMADVRLVMGLILEDPSIPITHADIFDAMFEKEPARDAMLAREEDAD
jgi:NTP pyrophosphatase (non-canonical NTP hydrolase)